MDRSQNFGRSGCILQNKNRIQKMILTTNQNTETEELLESLGNHYIHNTTKGITCSYISIAINDEVLFMSDVSYGKGKKYKEGFPSCSVKSEKNYRTLFC